MAIVYQHKTLDNDTIFYIGIGKIKNRAYSINKRNPLHKNIIQKHGVVVEILFENITWEDACTIEKELIKKYGRRDSGTGILVNMTDGGDGLNNPSEYTRKKISIGHRGKKMSDQFKVNQSNRMLGNTISPAYHTDAAKGKMKLAWSKRERPFYKSDRNLKISIALKGRKKSDEVKDKISKSLLGKTWIEKFGKEKADEIKRKIRDKVIGQKRPKQSESMKGKESGFKGRKHSDEFKENRKIYFLSDKNPGKNKSEETKKRISESHKGKISTLKGIPRKKVICPYCRKEGGEGLMHRWHFDNCKYK